MPTPPSPRRRAQRAGLIERDGTHDTVLLILDMVSCWNFPDGAALQRQAARMAPCIARLKQRCVAAKVPVIHANDNSGQRRSDFKVVVNESLGCDSIGAEITRALRPGDVDYFVLKPKHSAFFATPLEILLDHLRAKLALAMIRISGRRSFGQRRPFDACATVLLGAVLSRAVVGASPFWPTMAAGAVIVLLHRFVAMAMASLRWPRFEPLVSGDKRELVRDGRCDLDEMQKALITERDLDEAIRKKGGDERRPVRRAVLERDGVVTVDLARDVGQ